MKACSVRREGLYHHETFLDMNLMLYYHNLYMII